MAPDAICGIHFEDLTGARPTCHSRVEIKFINEAEAKLGVKFPASFVVKMTKLNGGSVASNIDDWELYPFMDSSDRKGLARTCNDIVRETHSARQSPHFPPEAVAIGANGGGDHLVLLPQADAPHFLSHEVFWWDHETGEINHVADDFADLKGARIIPAPAVVAGL